MDALFVLRLIIGTAFLIDINVRRPLHRPLHLLHYAFGLFCLWPTSPVDGWEAFQISWTPPTPPLLTPGWSDCSTPLKHHAISLVSNLTRECTDYWVACPLSTTLRTAYDRSNPPRHEISPFDFVGSHGDVRTKLHSIRLEHQSHHMYEWATPTTSYHEHMVDAHAECLRPGRWWWTWLSTAPTRLLNCYLYRSLRDWAALIKQAHVWRLSAVKELDRLQEEYTELSEKLIPQRMSLDEQYYDGLESEYRRQIQKIATDERRRPRGAQPPLPAHDLQTRMLVALTHMAHSAGILAWSQQQQQMVSTLADRVSTLSKPKFSQLPPSADQLHNLSTTIAGLDNELDILLQERANPAGTKVYTDAATAWIEDFFAELESKQQQEQEQEQEQENPLPLLRSTPLACWGNEYPFEKYFRKITDLNVR